MIRNGKILSPSNSNEVVRPSTMNPGKPADPEKDVPERQRRLPLDKTSRRMVVSAEKKMQTLQNYKN